MDKQAYSLEQKILRQRFQASRLQRAHNRALRRLRDKSEECRSLMRLVEAHGAEGQYLLRLYAEWCASRGIKTRAQKAVLAEAGRKQRDPLALESRALDVFLEGCHRAGVTPIVIRRGVIDRA